MSKNTELLERRRAAVPRGVANATPIFAERALNSELWERYPVLLKNKLPQAFPEAPGVDSPYWWAVEKTKGVDPFPGLDMRKVDMEASERLWQKREEGQEVEIPRRKERHQEVEIPRRRELHPDH